MKILVTLLLALVPHMALASDANITLDSAPFDLMTKSSPATFRVNYPGLGEHSVCSIELNLSRSSKTDIRQVLQVLRLRESFGDGEISPAILDPRKAIIGLYLGTYVTIVIVSPRYQGSLQSELERIGVAKGQLTISGRGC